jgi:hypothetical protein
MEYPNLVIGGAPKCGTTSLFNWLVGHPDVCGSKSKEPFFLVDKEHPLLPKCCNVHDHGLEAYARVFPISSGKQEIVLEASTHYMYQKTALDILPSLPTKPRIIFLLRKPSDRIFSSFAYSKAKGNVRNDLSFAQFVRLISDQPDQIAVPDWASRASAYVLPRDVHYSRYIDYLAAWRERLGDERMRVVILETMRVDPKVAVQGLCSWLGIDPSFYDRYDFAVRNRTSQVRSQRVQRIAVSLAWSLRAGPVKEALKSAYTAVQSTGRSEPRTEADGAALADLDEYFRPYNERLAREFGLDLSAWE